MLMLVANSLLCCAHGCVYTCTVHWVGPYSCLVIHQDQFTLLHSLYKIQIAQGTHHHTHTTHKARCWAQVPQLKKVLTATKIPTFCGAEQHQHVALSVRPCVQKDFKPLLGKVIPTSRSDIPWLGGLYTHNLPDSRLYTPTSRNWQGRRLRFGMLTVLQSQPFLLYKKIVCPPLPTP